MISVAMSVNQVTEKAMSWWLHLVSKEFWALGVFLDRNRKTFYKGENRCMLRFFSCRQFSCVLH